MSVTKRKLIVSSILSIGLFMSAFNPSLSARAEEELMDFSIDLDDLPPQPSQAETADLEVTDVESDVVPLDITGIETENFDATEIVDQVIAETEEPVVSEVVALPVESLTPLNAEPDVVVDLLGVDAPSGSSTHSGMYYESGGLVPDGALGASVGPREVDPKYEPASRFVVVSKAAGANSTHARIVAAERAIKLGRYTAALELSEDLYAKAPKNKQVLMGLAVAQQHSGFTASAIATYEELLVLDPKNTNAMVNMLGLIKKQYPAIAYRKLKELWSNNSMNPALAAQLGLASASMGNLEDAIRYLGVAASIEPNNASHYYNMAVVSDQAGAYKDAVELYQKSLEVDVTYGGSRSVPRTQIYDRLANLRRL